MKRMFSYFISVILCIPVIAQVHRVELKSINSDSVEYAPSISADGQTLIFQSNRNGEYQLFESRRNSDGQWSLPKALEGGINNFGKESDLIGGPSISYDGNRIYFFASYEEGMGSEDIYYSKREGDKWGSPINIGAPINSRAYEGFPSISSDGRSLYFIRLNKNMVNNFNCYTMMVSHKSESGKWGRPSTLPRPINSGCEKFPRIMPDNETLIFSSIRSGSIKNTFDLYETQLSEDGSWSTPKPLSFANTSDHDYFATISSKADLMYLNFKGVKDYDFFSFEIPKEFKPKKVVNIQGNILSEKKIPLHSFIKVFKAGTGAEFISIESNESDGSYTIVIPEGTYTMQVNKEGYIAYEETLNIEPVDEYHLFEKNVILEKFRSNITLKPFNDLSKKPISAKFIVIDSVKNQPVKIENNILSAEYGTVYNIIATSEGFSESEARIEVLSTEKTERSKWIYLPPIQPEIKITPSNADTGKPMPITLMLKNISKKKYVYRGKLLKDTILNLDFKSIYSVYAVAKNCLFMKDVINFSKQKEYKLLDYPIALKPIKPGAKLTLKEIYFKSGSSELDDSSNKELAAVYGFLKSRKNLIVEISAHTDNIGSEVDNLKLSKERATAVVDYLLAKGINKESIVGKGYGESRPFASNATKNGRSKNRRVEFKVLKVN